MDTAVEVTGVLTQADIEAVQALARIRPLWRRVLAYGFVAYVVVQTAASTYFAVTGRGGWLVPGLLWLALLVTAVARLALPRILLSSFRRRHPAGLPVDLVFTKEGIRDRTSNGQKWIPWETIDTWRQRNDVLVLYQGRGTAAIVSTGALLSDDARRLHELLREKLGEAA